jgi:hypothetical protein
VLAAIIQNLQNGPQPSPKPRLPRVDIDRGGGGQLWPRYQIIDYIQAVGTFRELPNEHPVDRAARRTEHIGRELARIQERREAEQKAMAVGMLWGAALQRQTMTATIAELEAAAEAARNTPPPKPSELVVVERGMSGSRESGGGTAIAVMLLGVGAIAAIAIARSRSRR